MNWAFSLGLLIFFLACAHKVTPSRDLANLEKSQMLKIWKNSLRADHTSGKHITIGRLEQIYLSSIDEDDFLEHFLHLNPASTLLTKNDYDDFFQTLSLFQDHLKLKTREKKAKLIIQLVDDLKVELKDGPR